MGTKTITQSLIDKTIKGQFNHVYSYIKNNNLPLQQDVAIKLIVACCNVCYNNLTSLKNLNLNETDLVKLIKLILPFIKTPLEDCEAYLQSAFYILKWLVDKKCFECIFELQELLMPEFLPLLFTEKQSSVYRNISIFVYNTIVKMSKSKDSSQELVLKLCYLLSGLLKKASTSSKFIFESVHNCIIILATLNADCENIVKFYNNSFDLIENTKESSLYCLLINNFSFLYTHLLKNEKFKLANECYAITLKKLSRFKGQEYIYCSEILKIAHWMNPLNQDNSLEVLSKVHKNLKNHYRQYDSTTTLQAVCDVISSAAFVMLKYYKNTNHSQWLNHSIQLHLELYKCLYDVSHIMSKTVYECHCKNCSTKTNINEALRILDVILGLGCLCLKNKPETVRTYKMDLFRYVEKYTDLVETLKMCDCIKWKSYWNEIAATLYKIGVESLRVKDVEICILYLKKFVQVLLKLEGVNSTVADKNCLHWALSGITEAYFESRDYEKCLFTCAFNIFLNNPKNEIIRWIKTKATCRENSIQEDNGIQELTWVSVCRKFESELDFYDPNKLHRISKEKQIELLVSELRNYKMKWKSKISMMSAYRELTRIADSRTCTKIFIEIWGDCDLQVHESIPKLLHCTIKKFESDTITSKNGQNKFHLAYLYFLQHKYRVKDTLVKHCDEMEKTMMHATKTINENEPIPPDPNEECDIVSTYNSLKLSSYLQMMKELNKSLDILSEIFVNKQFETLSVKDNELFKLLMNIGHEYNLHCHSIRTLQAWQFALKVAIFDNNKLYQLQAISSIIQVSEFTKVQDLIKDGEEIASLFQTKLSHMEDVIHFYLSKAESCFYVDFKVAYAAFLQALELQRQKCPSNRILQARIHLLHHRFVMLPCHYSVEDHKEYSLVKIHQAQSCIIHHYSESSNESAYEMNVFFEIHEALVKMYHELRLPREVRCYSKEVVLLAQKMLLPLRTITFLCYLAHADVSSNRLDDCKVKVMGISDILGLSKFKTVARRSPERQKFDKVVDNLVSEFNEMMLDVPVRRPKTNPGSPSFAVENFQMPGFLYHQDTCECFYCTCVEYHQYVLKKTYLHALLFEYENNLEIAKEYFCGCIRIYQSFEAKPIYMKKMSSDLVTPPQNLFLETFCLILYEYGNFCLRSGKINNAEKINTKLFETLEPVSLQYINLYNEVLAQKLNILMVKVPQTSYSLSNSAVCEDLNTGMIEKTPESKQNAVFITPEDPSEYLEIVKIKPKTLKFDLSDEEEDNVETKKTASKNIPYNVTKTPAPSSSKIKIYTNKSSKKKMVLSEIPPYKKDPNARESDFLVPASSNGCTPAAVKMVPKVDSVLINRTKLLTDRLKSSTKKKPSVIMNENGETNSVKKVPSIVITDENGAASNTSRPRRGSVRQNLLSQLEGSELEERNGAIRRSTRNRK